MTRSNRHLLCWVVPAEDNCAESHRFVCPLALMGADRGCTGCSADTVNHRHVLYGRPRRAIKPEGKK